jgi:hypothetical protein
MCISAQIRCLGVASPGWQAPAISPSPSGHGSGTRCRVGRRLSKQPAVGAVGISTRLMTVMRNPWPVASTREWSYAAQSPSASQIHAAAPSSETRSNAQIAG